MSTTKGEKSGYELVDAVMKNDIVLVKQLLDQGADANMTTFTAGREISAMDLAQSHNNPQMIKILKEYGSKKTEEGAI